MHFIRPRDATYAVNSDIAPYPWGYIVNPGGIDGASGHTEAKQKGKGKHVRRKWRQDEDADRAVMHELIAGPDSDEYERRYDPDEYHRSMTSQLLNDGLRRSASTV